MFFESWWQGLAFGIVTFTAMAALCYAFTLKWSKFTGEDKKITQSVEVHH